MQKYLTALCRLQHEALLVVTSGIRYTAVQAIAAEIHVLPIEQQLLEANYIAYLRLRSNPLTAGYGTAISDTGRKAHWRFPPTRLIAHHQQHYQQQPPMETIQPFFVPL